MFSRIEEGKSRGVCGTMEMCVRRLVTLQFCTATPANVSAGGEMRSGGGSGG